VNFAVTTDKLPPDRFREIQAHCQELGSRLYAELRRRLQEVYGGPGAPQYVFDLQTGEQEEELDV
jgi:hypothetical protein